MLKYKRNKISDSINPHNLKSLKLKVYWTLDKLENKQSDRFSIQEIVDYLIENVGIKTSPQAVRYALGADKKAIHEHGGKYKLMQCGKNLLQPKEDNIFYINPHKPFTGKRYAADNVFSKLKGDIMICDPYCGPGLLDFIFKCFNKNTLIRILTQKIIDKPSGTFSRTLDDIRDENYNLQIKIYKCSTLHDRYIIDCNNIWLSGNSFNDLGKKESFIVLLGKDIKQSVLSTFNNRWKAGKIFE